jgi:uncharacterized protein (PEP-CTERM system associated)
MNGGWRRGLTAAVLVVAGIMQGSLAAAQVVSGGADVLPPLPNTGFGVPNVAMPANAENLGPPSNPIISPSLRLPSPGAGIITLQQSNPNAPALLIIPRVTLSEALTDNAQVSPTSPSFDAETRLQPGLTISSDTPRLQGILTGHFEYDKYAVNSTEDRLTGNMYSNGTAVGIPDHLYADLNSAATAASRFGGAGFAPTSQLSQSTLTELFSTSVSPYFREDYRGDIESELRYRFSSTDFSGTSTSTTPASTTPTSTTSTPAALSTAPLSSIMTNEVTASVATGTNFERLLSKLTLDASRTDTTGVAQSTRNSDYDDLEYRINPWFAPLGRLGYENIQYPLVPAATTAGVLWQVGSRVELGPDNQYAELRYGKEEGIYGVTGSGRYEITPVTIVTASATQGVGSTQEQIQGNVVASNLDQYGQIVDQYGQPTAFANPEFALQNDVFRDRRYKLNLQTALDVNRFLLFAFEEERTSLSSKTPPTATFGANLTWSRDINPGFTSSVSLGYSRVSHSNLIAPGTTAPAGLTPGQTSAINGVGSTATAQFGLTYVFSPSLTGSAVYGLTYTTGSSSAAVSGTATISNIIDNRLEFSLTKTF